MRVNIRDVAEKAGVSIATVSYVLNGTKHVRQETEEKVLSAINDLGYVPDIMARNFKTGKRNLIACIVPDISNCFWSQTVEAIEHELAKHDFMLLITNTKESVEKERSNLSLLTSGMVDGIIIGSTAADYSEIGAFIPQSFPMVFIDRIPENCFSNSVTISNYASVFNGVCELIRSGHKKIGFLSGLEHLSTTKERLNAYKDALSKNDISFESAMVRAGNSMSMSALKPALELLDIGCTALVISNNVMASDVQSYLFRKKNDLAARTAILGYSEGSNDICMMKPFGLISQPTVQMGEAAAGMIMALVSSGSPVIQKFNLSSSLTLFGSH